MKLVLGLSDGGNSHDLQARKCETHFVGEKCLDDFLTGLLERRRRLISLRIELKESPTEVNLSFGRQRSFIFGQIGSNSLSHLMTNYPIDGILIPPKFPLKRLPIYILKQMNLMHNIRMMIKTT
jgi:hypothetical protein